MLRIAMLLIVLGVVGCVQQQAPKPAPKVDMSSWLYSLNAKKVMNGMSEAEVIAMMGGRPSSRSEMDMPQGKVKALGWTHYYPSTGKSYAVFFNFLDDKVNGRSESEI